MKIVKPLSCCFFASILFAIGFFPKGTEAKEWTPIPKDPSPYFFVDTERGDELIRIDGVRNPDGSFQEGMLIYRSVDRKNFSPLIIEGVRVEETSIGESPIRREWIILKDLKSEVEYEFFHSKLKWLREPQQTFEVIFLKSASFGDHDQSVREYVRTSLSCKKIRSLNINKQ